ncbi:hypothetical protein L596_016994 [Steinernema carpocapsae]|uniref:PLAT domain-containing protein n=1 Tax=Steinernema carpocapsae TaxID=34508 RepID=A0A4U5N048_STECR|nr:hypothetical protein L596_016994 [Steinernema carpocapsae]
MHTAKQTTGRYGISVRNQTIRTPKLRTFLVPDGTKRSSVKSFEIQATVLVDKDGTTIPDVFTQIYENNQGPSDGECSIDKLAAKNIENVTVACSGWVDEDSVSVYNVYSRLGENDPLVLVSSSSDPKQVFRLRSGEQQLFVEVLDGLRAESSLVPLGTAVVTLEKVNIGDLMISNPMEVKQILDQLKNTTNMNELLNEKTNSSKNAGWVNELIDAIGTKGGQKNVIDAVRKGLQRQLSVDTAKMSEEELQHLVDTSLRDRNAALAELMGKMLEVTAEKGINTPEDMKTVLSTVDDVLKNSMKFTLNKKQPGQSSANGYKVFYGRLRIKGTDLIVLNAQFTIDGATVFIQGDFQPAKVMMTSRDKFDLALNYRKLAAYVSLAKGFGFTVDGTTADVSDMINGTRRIDFTGNNSMGLPDGRYVAWNVSYDSKKDMETHEIENATFTTYTLLQPDSAITLEQLTEEQKKGFMFGDALNVIKISLKVYLDHKKQTLEYTGGKMELMDSFSGSMNLFIHDLEWTNKGSYDENYRTLIQDTVKIEFLDKAVIERAVASNGPTELKLTGENLRLQTGYYDVSHLAITPLEAHIQSSRLEIDKKYATMEAFNIDFKNGKAVNVDFGSISMDHGPLFDVLRGQVMLDGDSLKLAVDSEASLVTFSKIQWTVHAEGSKVILVITKGAFSTNLQPHIASVFDVGPEQRIFLEGGKIGRNCSNCYVIKDARVSSLTGGLEGDNGLQEQSVIDQRGLQSINKALDNTNDFLKNNADKLSDKELGETADSILGIVGSVTKSINTGLKNPLSNDLQASFDYEQKNYDDLFLNVPDDPRDIRYVEEYTPEQWAEEAVRLRQKAAAKAMVNTINTLFNTIEDALVKRALDTGDTSPITRSVDGNSLTASIGLPHDLLSKDYMCNDWIVRFPPRLDLLNVYDIGERELIRTSMRCLVENLYLSSDNAKYLVTSGTLDLKLKRQNGEEIVVKDTLEPISLKTDPKGYARNAIEILPFKFEKYQVLDLHTFRTIQWNMTVTIEFEPTQKLQKDVWLFASFQRIPGPMPSDHDWRFHVTEKRFRSYFHILAAELWNRTGLFYVGIGVIAEGERALNPNLSISYPAHEFKHWVFENTPSFDYKIRAISKGCYYLNTVHRDARFDSTGMEPLSTTGTGRTSCLSNHLTTFSVGMFTPEIAQNFEYKYLETRYERNIMVLIAVAILAIHQLLAFFLAIRHDNRDFSKGGIQTLKDNRPFDHYQYVITVQTGYRMFSTTDSRVFFNVTGTQSEEIGRQMVGEMSKIKSFQWGATDRFLMTTRWSLGDLHTLRIWIDSSGFEHRQSWFCCRVVFKDLQTKKIYEFDVDNWLGIQNGNGEVGTLVFGPSFNVFFQDRKADKRDVEEGPKAVESGDGASVLRRPPLLAEYVHRRRLKNPLP